MSILYSKTSRGVLLNNDRSLEKRKQPLLLPFECLFSHKISEKSSTVSFHLCIFRPKPNEQI